MRRFAALAALCFLAGSASSAAALPGFEAGVRGIYWFPDLSAKVQSFTPPPVGTKFDAEDDLGVGDENIPAGEVFLRIGRLHLRAGYTPVSFDGRNTLTRDIVFNGQTFSISEEVVSRLDVEMFDGEVQVDLLRPDLVAANFSLGLVAKVKHVDGEVELRTTAQTERKDFRTPFPMVGVAVGVGFLEDMLRVDARGGGIAFSGNRLVEGDASLSVIPFPFLRFQGGFRLIDLKVDKDDIVAELRLAGPYVGAQISF